MGGGQKDEWKKRHVDVGAPPKNPHFGTFTDYSMAIMFRRIFLVMRYDQGA